MEPAGGDVQSRIQDRRVRHRRKLIGFESNRRDAERIGQFRLAVILEHRAVLRARRLVGAVRLMPAAIVRSGLRRQGIRAQSTLTREHTPNQQHANGQICSHALHVIPGYHAGPGDDWDVTSLPCLARRRPPWRPSLSRRRRDSSYGAASGHCRARRPAASPWGC